MTRCGGEMPNTILSARVRVWIVGAANFTVWRRYFMLATAFFAVMSVLVQCESIVARTLVRSGCIFALVLATTVVDRTLVHICADNNNSSKRIRILPVKRIYCLPVKKTAANPVLCTELSDSNSTRSAFASDVIMEGASWPQ